MYTDEEIEANKRRAAGGWLTDPPPHTPEPLPEAHEKKWFRMMGATYLLGAQDNSDKNRKEKT